MNPLLKAALEYSEKFNYPIIPCSPKDKKPLIPWLEFQKRKASNEEIQGWWQKWPNAMIGGLTGKISGDFVVDIDSSQGDEAIRDYIPDSLLTPTSKTPRGGKHLHFQNPKDEISIKAGLFPHVDYRGQGGYVCMPPSRNTEGGEYVWLDGLSLSDLPRAFLPNALLSYIKEFALVFYHARARRDKPLQNDKKFFEFGTRDEGLFHVANTMTKGGGQPDIISEVLERLILSWGENPDKKWIDAKIKSALDRAERRERNLAEDIGLWVSVTERDWSVTECDRELQIVTKEQKAARRQVIHRLKEAGIIEKSGKMEGIYRRIESSADEIDFLGVDEKVVEIDWPFEVQKWVKILPKNIIVIAGEANAGKTAFLLNTCFLNMGRFKINFFSSEMGAMELRDRLKKFEVNLAYWKENINFRERGSNFGDVVKPNDVNIIDFLEITDEFYRVGGMIKEIYDRLKKGIAIIALQKNPKTDFGLGGMRSVEKARLYLSIENGKIKIVKGKNWATEVNPNGIWREFKLIQGAKFISKSEWKRG